MTRKRTGVICIHNRKLIAEIGRTGQTLVKFFVSYVWLVKQNKPDDYWNFAPVTNFVCRDVIFKWASLLFEPGASYGAN